MLSVTDAPRAVEDAALQKRKGSVSSAVTARSQLALRQRAVTRARSPDISDESPRPAYGGARSETWASMSSSSQRRRPGWRDRFRAGLARLPRLSRRGAVAMTVFSLWAFVVTLLVIVSSVVYEGGAVDETAARFAQSRAQRTGAEVAGTFAAAVAVYDAFNYAVQQKLYLEPQDYGAIRRVLAPLFLGHVALRSVDLALMGRNFSVSVRRRLGVGRRLADMPFVMQSNASDCRAALGPRGCLAAVPGPDLPWYKLAAGLPGNQESSAAELRDYAKYAPQGSGPHARSTSFRWLSAPRFVRRDENSTLHAAGEFADAGQAQLQWLTAYSLVFRSVFPGTRGKLSVVGRATLSIDGLRSGGALATGLGDGLSASSLVVVCDSAGVVVAAQEPGLQLLVESPSGRVRFRKAWEMEGPWASGLSPGAFQAAGTSFDAEGFHVAVVPLLGRGLEGFFVVVAVERRPFVDVSLRGTAESLEAMVSSPYPVAVVIFLAWSVYHWYVTRRRLKRVQPMVCVSEAS